MATSLARAKNPGRGPRVITALLYAVHALSLPVRMGLDYVCRSQMYFWSCQHSICALECGVFLWKWLLEVESTSAQLGVTGLVTTYESVMSEHTN